MAIYYVNNTLLPKLNTWTYQNFRWSGACLIFGASVLGFRFPTPPLLLWDNVQYNLFVVFFDIVVFFNFWTLWQTSLWWKCLSFRKVVLKSEVSKCGPQILSLTRKFEKRYWWNTHFFETFVYWATILSVARKFEKNLSWKNSDWSIFHKKNSYVHYCRLQNFQGFFKIFPGSLPKNVLLPHN